MAWCELSHVFVFTITFNSFYVIYYNFKLFRAHKVATYVFLLIDGHELNVTVCPLENIFVLLIADLNYIAALIIHWEEHSLWIDLLLLWVEISHCNNGLLIFLFLFERRNGSHRQTTENGGAGFNIKEVF